MVLKKVSRGLSRVEAGHPGVPRLVQVTSGVDGETVETVSDFAFGCSKITADGDCRN